MHSFSELSILFESNFSNRQFPEQPATLYDAAQYILTIGGKRVRPIVVLMGNELFSEIHKDAFQVAKAIELFHNFSLIHDDIMDKAPLRRGMETVHIKHGESTALLAGDAMLVVAYEQLIGIDSKYLNQVLTLFSKTAKEVCEGQQLDMDFEKMDSVSLEQYIEMIALKTSVLLAASLQMGSVIGGAKENDQQYIYQFGKNLGIAFQLQDDYLDAFGDPEKFGKQIGGDILANKKTCLLIRALEVSNPSQKAELVYLLQTNDDKKVEKVLDIFRACEVGEFTHTLKEKYFDSAMSHLDQIEVNKESKSQLLALAKYLLMRDS